MGNLKIKVCGMTDAENVQAVCKHRPDFIGFIFFENSVRYVGSEPDPGLFSAVPEGVRKTAVFVNEQYGKMVDILTNMALKFCSFMAWNRPKPAGRSRYMGKL